MPRLPIESFDELIGGGIPPVFAHRVIMYETFIHGSDQVKIPPGPVSLWLSAASRDFDPSGGKVEPGHLGNEVCSTKLRREISLILNGQSKRNEMLDITLSHSIGPSRSKRMEAHL